MRISRIKGIDIKIHLSTLLIIGLVGFYTSTYYLIIASFPSLIELFLVGILSGMIIILSILLHELAHSLVAQKYGLIVSEIELYIFGGVSKIEKEPETPKSEIIIAIVGPSSSLIIGMVFLLIIFLFPSSLPTFVFVIFYYTGISNIGLGLFNLIPAFPIDGGRVLRGFLWYRKRELLSATKTASKIGSFLAYGLMAYGFFQMILFGFINGFWLIIIGSFLNRQSKQSYIQVKNDVILSKVYAKEMISKPQIEIPFEMLLSDAISNYFMIYKKSYFPVIQKGRIVGIIHMNDIKKIKNKQRVEYIVGYVMRKASGFPAIDERESGIEVMKKLIYMKEKPQLVVVKGDHNKFVLGFIGVDELTLTIKLCQLNLEKC